MILDQSRWWAAPENAGAFATALRLVRHRLVAVDIGAHVGIWAASMAGEFEVVHAFEPLPPTFALLEQRIAGNGVVGFNVETGELVRESSPLLPNVQAHKIALADRPCFGRMACPAKKVGSTFSTFLLMPAMAAVDDVLVDEGPIPVTTLDLALADDPYPVAMIKIDVEGAEALVLAGAHRILRRDLPIIILERSRKIAARYGLTDSAATEFLIGLGYREIAAFSPNVVMAMP